MALKDAANRSPSRPMRRLALRVMIYLLVAVAAYVAIVLVIQRRVLFPRHVIPQPAALAVPADVQRLELETDAGPIEAWFVPSLVARRGRPGPAVIFAHGNAELIDHNLDMARDYTTLGVSVLMPEYRGYGRSAGSPSQKAIVQDFLAWYDRLAARPDVDPQRIVIHGRSLGGAVAAQVALHRPVRGLVLESTFTSVSAMAWRFLVPPLLVRDPFDTLAAVRAFEGPILLLHGTTDNIVPANHAVQLHAAAGHAVLVNFDGGHNDVIPAEMYWGEIDALLRRAGASFTGERGRSPVVEDADP